jgi:dTDP-4-dehydrorhamnose 3,5-epimerase
VVLVEVTRHGDERGYFAETFRKNEFQGFAGSVGDFVQENESVSERIGTVRGLHFQRTPKAQGKLVRVVKGAVFDVALDIRPNSPTFGEHVSAELTAANGRQLWIPAGFAHGFATTEPATLVTYKVTDYYDKATEAGVRWDDPDLAIGWPVSLREAVVNAKDRTYAKLADITDQDLR